MEDAMSDEVDGGHRRTHAGHPPPGAFGALTVGLGLVLLAGCASIPPPGPAPAYDDVIWDCGWRSR
jgi:hypothetical protein